MKKSLFIGGLLLASIGLMGAGCGETVEAPTRTTTPPITNSTSSPNTPTTPTTPQSQTKSFTNKAGTFSFNTPSSFSVTETPFVNGEKAGTMVVQVTSPWYMEEESASGRGEKVKHVFALNIEMSKTGLDDTTKKESPQFESLLKDLKGGKKVDPASAGMITVDGKSGYYFVMGAEGTNMRHIFIPKSATETLLVSVEYMGDSLARLAQPSPTTESAQLAAVQAILDSFKFLK